MQTEFVFWGEASEGDFSWKRRGRPQTKEETGFEHIASSKRGWGWNGTNLRWTGTLEGKNPLISRTVGDCFPT